MRLLFHSLTLSLAILSGCAQGVQGDPNGPLGDGKADGPGAATTLARCFVASDRLTCARDGASGSTVTRIEVGFADGRSETIAFEEADQGDVGVDAAAYPLTLDLEARIDAVDGADAQEFWLTQIVDQPEDLSDARAFFAPYDLWTLVVDNLTDEGDVGFDGHALFLEGADVPRSEDGTLSVPATNAILARGEVRTFVIPVTRGTRVIHGTARDLSATDVLTPFSLERPGRYTLTAEGLFEAGDDAPSASPVAVGGAVARCGSFEVGGTPHLTCYVVTRPGVILAHASVTVDGETIPLPVDGTVIDLGPLAASSTEVWVAVQLASGIEGLGNELAPIEGALHVSTDGEASLDFPFDLLHVEVTVDAEVRAAMFDGPNPHVVELTRRWGGLTQTQYQLRRRLGPPTDRNFWIAVSAGVTDVAGEVAVFETETPDRYPTTLTSGDRVRVTRDGPIPD
jgi:hypothetical protein